MDADADTLSNFMFWQYLSTILAVVLGITWTVAALIAAFALAGIMKAHERIASTLDTLATNLAGARPTSPRD